MRISDWSSDVCSSDLEIIGVARSHIVAQRAVGGAIDAVVDPRRRRRSRLSTRTPAGIANSNQGRRVANATRAMSAGSRVMSVASQGKARAETQSPRFEMAEAEKRRR